MLILYCIYIYIYIYIYESGFTDVYTLLHTHMSMDSQQLKVFHILKVPTYICLYGATYTYVLSLHMLILYYTLVSLALQMLILLDTHVSTTTYTYESGFTDVDTVLHTLICLYL